MRASPTPHERFSRESLATYIGIPPRKISYWVTHGLIPPAHGTNSRWKYYDDIHVQAIRALLAVIDNNTTYRELAAYMAEQNISVVDYVKERRIARHA